MSMEEMQLHCFQCRRLTLHRRILATTPHVLHCLLTFLFCGLWAIVWLSESRSFSRKNRGVPFLCSFCGTTYDAEEMREFERQQKATMEYEQVKAAESPAAIVKDGQMVCPTCRVEVCSEYEFGKLKYYCSKCSQQLAPPETEM